MGHGVAATTLAQVGCSSEEAAGAVLEADERRALVSVWSASHPALEVVLETNGAVRSRSIAFLGEDGTGVARLDELAPGTRHRAIVTAGGSELFERTFTTAPAEDDTRDVRLAVISDVNVSRDMSLFDLVRAADTDFTVTLGDFPYADEAGRIGSPAQILSRHVELRTLPQIQQFVASTSLRSIYDDHEVCNNWGGGDLRGEEVDACQAALAVWDGFFPRHDPAAPRYRSWRWGAHLECFLLDTRLYRSPGAMADDAAKTMLGLAQRVWLLDAVSKSTATFKIVFSPVPLDFGNGEDHWSGYRAERDLILDAFAKAGTTGLLIVSGDQHWFAAHVHRHGVREFQIGPTAARIFEPPPQVDGVLYRAMERNFGLIDVGASGLRFRSMGIAGTLYDETFAPDDLRLRDPSGIFF